MVTQTVTINSKLERMLGFLEHDPDNLTLLSDTVHAAFEAGSRDIASKLINRYAEIAALPDALINLAGLIALADGDHASAAGFFSTLLSRDGTSASLRFNLAWARAMQADYAGALELLDETTLAASPRAPALKIRMMHHLGLHQEALAEGIQLIPRFPPGTELLGALSMVAIDADEPALAQQFAQKAGPNSYEALASLGALQLQDSNNDEALRLFEQALVKAPASPRALLGKGMCLLAENAAHDAAPFLDKAAEVFGSHLGSWLASGWAYFAQGDYATARKRFETALSIDDSFSEIHGSLAVLDALEGDHDSATRRSTVALRLDRDSLSAALARSLMMDAAGQPDIARHIRNRAMTAPVGAKGETLLETIVRFGSRNQRS